MEENSKVVAPSELTVQSYKSQSVSKNNSARKRDGNDSVLDDIKISTLDKLNNFLTHDLGALKGGDSSLEQT